MDTKRDLAITYLSGEQYCQNPMVMVYANTLKENFQGDRVMLTHEMGDRERELFSSMGYEVVDVDRPRENHLLWLFWHRWKCLYSFLCDRNEYRYVLFTDSKDVLWQRDPISFIESGLKDDYLGLRWDVLLCDEGVRHSDCDWNTGEQQSLMATTRCPEYEFSDWKVVNGGVVAGRASGVKELAFTMQMMTTVGHGLMTDQCYINFLYHNRKNDPVCPYQLANPLKIPFVATGNTIKNNEWTPVRWHEGELRDGCAGIGRAFSIFHQWDRTKYRGEILTKHGIPRIG